MDAFVKLVAAGPLFFVSAWLLMIFAGIVGADVGIEPFGVCDLDGGHDRVLGRDRPSVLRPTRHPVLDIAARQAVLDQVRAAAGGEGPGRPDVGVVLALAGPCRLLEREAPDRSTRGEAKKQIARAAADTPFAPGVAKIIDELIDAVAVTAATTAAS